MKQIVKRIFGCLSSMMVLSSCIIPTLASYPDVALSSPNYAGIEYCQNKGTMSGFEDGLFHPEREITRGMVATILYRMHGSPAVNGQGSATSLPGRSIRIPLRGLCRKES